VLVTDMVMPGIGGPLLATRVAEAHPRVKVILITGYSQESVDGAALQGTHGFLEKPFRMERLLQEVRRVLDSDGE